MRGRGLCLEIAKLSHELLSLVSEPIREQLPQINGTFRLRRFVEIKRLVPRSNSATSSVARQVSLRRSG